MISEMDCSPRVTFPVTFYRFRTRKTLNLWVWREELNLQPAVYKLDSDQSDSIHEELTQGKTDESEEPSS